MASLIPPKRPARPGVPKLSLPISKWLANAVPPADEQGSKQDETSQTEEATIMPFHSQLASRENTKDQMDELQRAIYKMNIPDEDRKRSHRLSLGSLQASDVAVKDEQPPAAWDTAPIQAHGGQEMSRTSSSSDSGRFEPHSFVSEDDLEVLESLGEGASGEVAKARVKSSGLIVARKVRHTLLTSDHRNLAGSGHSPPVAP